MAARRKPKRQTFTLAELTEGASAYLAQARERVDGLATDGPLDRAALTAIEVARDDVREANKLMQRVHERAARAVAKAATGAATEGPTEVL